jgi:hypothetical protein
VQPEVEPPQPDEVVRAIRELAVDGAPEPDPWWVAGMDVTLAV